MGTKPDEVGNLNEGIACNSGGEIDDAPLSLKSEFELRELKVDDAPPGGDMDACSAAAAAAAACCCC